MQFSTNDNIQATEILCVLKKILFVSISRSMFLKFDICETIDKFSVASRVPNFN